VRAVIHIAIRDISKYLKEKYPLTGGLRGGEDIWIVSASSVYNKENIRLNRQLGIHKLNMTKN